MNIYRVDDRLIHGQVVENWLNAFSIDVIVVVNDEIVSDELRKNIMRFAVPEGVEVFFVKTDEVKDFSTDPNRNCLFLFETLSDVIKSLEKGFKIDRLNLGGIHFSSGRNFTLGKVVFLNDDDRLILRKILSMGIDVYRQAIPQETPVNIRDDI